jgi:three-Cys-motif partner protein
VKVAPASNGKVPGRAGPFSAGTLDSTGQGSKNRTIAERKALLESEAFFPVSKVYRPIQRYGLQKLASIRKYLWSYSVILNRHVRRNFAIVDGFSGPGILDLRPAPPEGTSRLDESVTPDELALGSPLLALSNHPNFPTVHLVEKESQEFDALRDRVDAYYPGRTELHHADANKALPEIAARLGSRGTRTLFILDPEGLELEMRTLYGIRANCATAEILLLYPSYMAVARCIRVPSTWNRLNRFFGDETLEDPSEGWETFLHRFLEGRAEELSDDEEAGPMHDLHTELLNYYQSRLGGAGFEVVLRSPVVRSDHRRPLYHLVFAGNNETGGKIMRDIFSSGLPSPP